MGPAVLLPNALGMLGREWGNRIDDEVRKESNIEEGKREESPQEMVKRDVGSSGRKEMAFATFACTAPIGCGLGGIIGSAFAEWVWWPWLFWVQGVTCAGLIVAAWLCVLARGEEEKANAVD